MTVIPSCVELSKRMKGQSMEDGVCEANVTRMLADRVTCLICPAGV